MFVAVVLLLDSVRLYKWIKREEEIVEPKKKKKSTRKGKQQGRKRKLIIKETASEIVETKIEQEPALENKLTETEKKEKVAEERQLLNQRQQKHRLKRLTKTTKKEPRTSPREIQARLRFLKRQNKKN